MTTEREPVHFDAYLPQMTVDQLKRYSARWGSDPKAARKDAMIVSIQDGLADPAIVRERLDALTPAERAAIALAKRHGGTVGAGALLAAMRASGYPVLDTEEPGYYTDEPFVRDLAQRGIFLVASPYGFGGGLLYAGTHFVTDDRILAQVGEPEVVPLELPRAPAPADVRARRPAQVSLALLTLFDAVDAVGGLQLTRSGEVRVPDFRRLGKQLGWGDDVSFDGLAFPQPLSLLIEVLFGARVLGISEGRVRVLQREQWLALPPHLQAARLLIGMQRLAGWTESFGDFWYSPTTDLVNGMRTALIALLGALPQETGAFYRVDDLSEALFARVGGAHSLNSYVTGMRMPGRATPADHQRLVEQRRRERRESWKRIERPWLDSAVASWLFFFGLVEVGVEDGRPASFALTELGLQALHPDTAVEASRPTGPAWMVQPDFAVVAYLEHATPTQLSLLGRVAERTSADTHVATYRLTRDSVYLGLERGVELEAMLRELESGGGRPLPPNVAATVRDWAALRDRVTLIRKARLLEFPDQESRDAALAGGLKAAAVGERFALWRAGAGRLPEHATVDYAKPLPPCVQLDESGAAAVVRPARDLLARPLLDRWAEPRGADAWQLTAGSVAAAIRGGGTLNSFLAQLEPRLTRTMPPLLGVALRAWAGQAPAAELGQVAILRFEDPDVAAAVHESARFRPFVRAALGNRALLVDGAALAQLRAALDWAGIRAAAIE